MRNMNASSPRNQPGSRASIGTVAFVVCCLLSSARLVHDAPNPAHLSADDIEQRSDLRFAVVKADLPRRGVIGYIGESGNAGTADYYLAQYALAPLVIDRSTSHAQVIGSFPTSSPEIPKDLQLVRDFGNGVLLFSGKGAQ